jgi:hypothetical protein
VTWSTPRVSSGCGEVGADRAGPRCSDSGAWGRMGNDAYGAALGTEREQGRAREGSGADRSAPPGRVREGAGARAHEAGLNGLKD